MIKLRIPQNYFLGLVLTALQDWLSVRNFKMFYHHLNFKTVSTKKKKNFELLFYLAVP